MPQLDITTHISQLLFTFGIFIYFYLNLITWVVPFLSQSLKVRKKKIKYSILNQFNIDILLLVFFLFKNLKFNKVFSTFITNLNFYFNSIFIGSKFSDNLIIFSLLKSYIVTLKKN